LCRKEKTLGRVVFLLIIAFLIYLLFKGFLRAQTRRAEEARRESDKVEDMVACARCGVNLPRSEARNDGALFYCRDNPRCIASS
jgi:uncharacterized protein